MHAQPSHGLANAGQKCSYDEAMGHDDAEDATLKGLEGKESSEKVDVDNLMELLIKCLRQYNEGCYQRSKDPLPENDKKTANFDRNLLYTQRYRCDLQAIGRLTDNYGRIFLPNVVTPSLRG
jgi:hypothetical protein